MEEKKMLTATELNFVPYGTLSFANVPMIEAIPVSQPRACSDNQLHNNAYDSHDQQHSVLRYAIRSTCINKANFA